MNEREDFYLDFFDYFLEISNSCGTHFGYILARIVSVDFSFTVDSENKKKSHGKNEMFIESHVEFFIENYHSFFLSSQKIFHLSFSHDERERQEQRARKRGRKEREKEKEEEKERSRER